MTTAELKTREKQEVSDRAEQTRSGPVFTPAVDIFEDEQGITLTADMPGVRPEGLTIDLREDTLTLTGSTRRDEQEQEHFLLREYEVGSYYRQFRLPNTIDRDRIEATLEQGVLKLVLPKAEASRPRRINVKSV